MDDYLIGRCNTTYALCGFFALANQSISKIDYAMLDVYALNFEGN